MIGSIQDIGPKSKLPINQSSVPQDNTYSWVVALCGLLLWCLATLNVITFGIYYVEWLEYFQAGKVKTSWISAIGLFIMGPAGMVSGELVNRFGFCVTGISGCVLGIIGLIITSFAKNINYIIVGYGIITGFGCSVISPVIMISVQTYFTKRRSLASGIAGLGVSICAFSLPPLIRYLIDEYGWRGSILIQSGFFLQGIPICCLITSLPKDKETEKETKTVGSERRFIDYARSFMILIKKSFDVSLLKDMKCLIYCLCMFGSQYNHFTMFSFTLARAVALGETKMNAALLMTFLGIGNGCGRIVFGWLGDKINRLLLQGCLITLAGLSSFISSFFPQHVAQAICCTAYGLLSGGFVILITTCACDLMGLKQLPKAVGLMSIFGGIAGLLALLFGGFIASKTGTYSQLFIISGILAMLAGLTVLALGIYVLIKKPKHLSSIEFISVPTSEK